MALLDTGGVTAQLLLPVLFSRCQPRLSYGGTEPYFGKRQHQRTR